MLPLSCREQSVLAKQHPSIADLTTKDGVTGLRLRVDSFLRFLDRSGCRVCFLGMEGYPASLGREENPPFRLCYRGRLPADDALLVSVCGTRYPDNRAAQESFVFALESGLNGVGVVTSHSRGIDRAALRGACRSGTAPFVCCDCGLGTDRIGKNRSLDGANLISPYEPYDRASRWRCLARNTLTVSLSPALVIFQAPGQSGALRCCTEALDAGRDVFVHRTGLRPIAANVGTRRLVSEGCAVVRDYGDAAGRIGFPRSVRLSVASQEGEALYRFGDTWYSLSHGTE